MGRYDIIIAGTGPAGVSAAITATVRKKNIMLIGSGRLSDKLASAHTILNYPGFPGISGPELAQRLLGHLKAMDISITEGKLNLVYNMGDYFAVQTSSNEFYEAESIILATGVSADKPYPGELEFLGRGVSYCATCDAPLYKGRTAAVIAHSPEEEREAEFLAEYAEKVYYLPQYKGEVRLRKGIEVIYERPVAFEGGFKAQRLVTDRGEYAVDGIFRLGGSIAPAQLVPGIETDGAHIKVDRLMKTSIPGCMACGDITGPPYQYIKAAGEGNTAALSAAKYLAEKRRRKNSDNSSDDSRRA